MSTVISPLSTQAEKRRKITTQTLRSKKQSGKAISMLTAYDYPTALALDQAGIDAILVGDSLGMVVLGYANTLPVTMEDMLHHCKAVSRAAMHALLIGDMPFLSYQITIPDAVKNAGKFLQEAGMDAVKLVGGREQIPVIEAILSAGIPVMGHLGLTPQSVNLYGGFKPQARTAESARRLYADAMLLEKVGCFSIVLESVPARLAEFVSQHLDIPTIGIGAGVGCDGQVLVSHDLLGLFDRFTPKFVKKYADIHQVMIDAFDAYKEEVEEKLFPGKEHSIDMPEEEWLNFLGSGQI